MQGGFHSFSGITAPFEDWNKCLLGLVLVAKSPFSSLRLEWGYVVTSSSKGILERLDWHRWTCSLLRGQEQCFSVGKEVGRRSEGCWKVVTTVFIGACLCLPWLSYLILRSVPVLMMMPSSV